jgi:ferritin-like protein
MRSIFARLVLLALPLFVQQSALASAVCCDLERITDQTYHTGGDDPDACAKCGYLSGANSALTPAAPATPSVDLLAVLSDRCAEHTHQTATAVALGRGPPSLD